MRTAASRKRSAFVRQVRAQGALTAYSTVLGWLRHYPAAEVEGRLVEKVENCRREVAEAGMSIEQLGQALRPRDEDSIAERRVPSQGEAGIRAQSSRVRESVAIPGERTEHRDRPARETTATRRDFRAPTVTGGAEGVERVAGTPRQGVTARRDGQ